MTTQLSTSQDFEWCLSLQQPFANLLCSGIKNIENRNFTLKHDKLNKWIVIHASKTRLASKLINEAIQQACVNPNIAQLLKIQNLRSKHPKMIHIQIFFSK